MKKSGTKNKENKKGFDISHKEQLPKVPPAVVHAPKEATDPSESIKHA